jgi:hypothetical protein
MYTGAVPPPPAPCLVYGLEFMSVPLLDFENLFFESLDLTLFVFIYG